MVTGSFWGVSAGAGASMASSGSGFSGVPTGPCGHGSAATGGNTLCSTNAFSPVPSVDDALYVSSVHDQGAPMSCPDVNPG